MQLKRTHEITIGLNIQREDKEWNKKWFHPWEGSLTPTRLPRFHCLATTWREILQTNVAIIWQSSYKFINQPAPVFKYSPDNNYLNPTFFSLHCNLFWLSWGIEHLQVEVIDQNQIWIVSSAQQTIPHCCFENLNCSDIRLSLINHSHTPLLEQIKVRKVGTFFQSKNKD